MMDLIVAAEVSRRPIIDIFAGVLSGSFVRVEVVGSALKFKGVLVDPIEVREVLSRQDGARLIGADEAARMTGLSRPAINALTRISRPKWLSVREKLSAKGEAVRMFPVDQLEDFLAEHISLKAYAVERECSSTSAKMKLDREGIRPVIDNHSLGRFFYRRTDLVD
ncbi:MAG: hypothetical protein AAF281_11490 [Pseudomonadota bacterium]